MENFNMCRPVFPGGVRDGEIMSKEIIHEAFELDLNDATTAEAAFAMLWIYYQALNEMVQPEAQDKDRMKKIRLMTPKVGHAITVYHAYARFRINELLEQLKKLEQRKTLGQRVKEWFRRGK
jgi:hypothetical protein